MLPTLIAGSLNEVFQMSMCEHKNHKSSVIFLAVLSLLWMNYQNYDAESPCFEK